VPAWPSYEIASTRTWTPPQLRELRVTRVLEQLHAARVHPRYLVRSLTTMPRTSALECALSEIRRADRVQDAQFR
jgi:hypothetical protein